MNPKTESCNFFPDSVLYRGRPDSQWYKADLELCESIDPDRSSRKIICNEPVLKLKQKPLYWDRLRKNKNIFLSYDLEHVDKDEDEAVNGLFFVADTGEHDVYVNSDRHDVRPSLSTMTKDIT